MNEWDVIKKQIKNIFLLTGEAIRARVEKAIFDFQAGQNRSRRVRIIIALGLSVIFFGGFLLSAISRGKVHVPGFLGPLGLESFLNHSIPGVRVDQDGNLLLCDFERKEDLSSWSKTASSIDLSKDHASDGLQSAHIVMEGGNAWSGIALQEFFMNNDRVSNWVDYETFQFYIFNPGKEEERLLIQIKDQWNRKYKSEFLVRPGEGMEVSTPIKTIGASINVRKIDQVSIFRWAPRDTKEFYLDNVRLVRRSKDDSAQDAARPARREVKKMSVNPVDYGFEARKKAWMIQSSEITGDAVRVPFVLVNETEAPCVFCPVEGGVPFPMGELLDVEHLRLRTAQDQELPVQPRVLARWPDGSVKWLAPHFLATLMPSQSVGLYLDYGPNVHHLPVPSLLDVQDKGGKIIVSTGKIRVTLSKKIFYLFQEVRLDRNENGLFEPEETIVSKAPLFVTSKAKEFRADRDHKGYEIEVEEEGPLRVVVKASGWFAAEDGQRFCKAIVRYYFYQGQSYVKVSHTFIYTGYPANTAYQGYKNLSLPENETVTSFGMRLPFSFTEPLQTKISLGAQAPEVIDLAESSKIRLLQSDWKKAEIQSDAENIPPSDYYSSWLDASDAENGVTVAVRDFRENFPKALGINRANGELQIDLWPAEAGEMNLATTPQALGPRDEARGSAFGLGKTHEILFYFHEKDAVQSHAPEQAYSFSKRMVIRNNPYWVDATGALGRLFPVSEKYTSQEKMLDRLFEWAARQPKMFRWYGMLNYGDTLSWYRSEDKNKKYAEPGWHPEGRWGWFHTEGVGMARGALLQFVRSGVWKYFQFGEASARHAMDVETIHYNTITQDDRLKLVLDPKMAQVGSMHRHGAFQWSGRTDEASHTQAAGILLYYYLSGEERALDVTKEIGDYYLTKPFAPEDHKDHAVSRAMANVLWGDVLLYEATGEERYKTAADKIAKTYVKGQQEDGSFLEYYQLKNETWNGKKSRLAMENHVLGALIAYHQLTQDEKVKTAILKLVKYCSMTPAATANSLHGIAYAYWLTHDKAYLAAGERSLQWLSRNQHSPRDPILDGMIYDKPTYFRPMQILATAPYIFAALEDGFTEALQQQGTTT